MHFPTVPSPNFHPNNSSVKWCDEYEDRTPPERQMENKQDGTLGDWFKITIPIFVNTSNAPYSVWDKLKPREMEQLKLKLACELDKMKGLKLEELWLEGNPLCSTFPDHSTYIRMAKSYPPPIVTDIVGLEIIKPCKESYRGSETLKNLVFQFLLQYYLIYDYGDRQSLLSAYHDKACFSLTIPFNPEDPAPSSLFEYFKNSRNIKEVKDHDLQVQLLKHRKRDIVDSLSALPKTQHDLNSYVVDLCVQKEMMLCFSVNGMFKEVEVKSQESVRAFTRTFILTFGSNSSLCIVNDELIVGKARTKETQSALSIPVPTSTSISMRSLFADQQEMVQVISTQSGMNLQLSQK
ncbi:nuclear RNA export factor 2-like [Hipposideros larvatus]